MEAKTSKWNFKSFLWHAVFLSLAANFMDVNTVVPSMILKLGGNSIHLGFLTTIMIGGASFMQLIFSFALSNEPYKKKWLLLGINVRVITLFLLAALFFFSPQLSNIFTLISLFVLITIFSFSGSFANISYIDINGKVIDAKERKHFFSLKQFLSSGGLIISALVARHLLKITVFPDNYSLLFLLAGGLLFIASFGFYALKELVPSTNKRRRFKDFFVHMPVEIGQNANLKNYLFIINFLGIGISLLPFVILLAKKQFDFTAAMVGNFVLYSTIGMLIGSLTLYFLAKKFSYKQVLTFDVFIGASLPIAALLLSSNEFLYQGIFVFAGIFASTYKISVNGMLIEISTNENRTFYAGISGAGNIFTMIFPIIAGVFISYFGFTWVFTFMSLSMLSSIYFIRKLNCK
jgi:MFS family permease